MRSKMSNAPGATIAESFRSRGPLPKRGQIKLRIAANAFHSIISVLSRASSDHHQSRGKPIF